MADKPWHRGRFRQRAKVVRDAANADPGTRCWRCGQLARPGDPWQAGHVRDGDESSPLAPEHRSCNARAGQRLSLGSVSDGGTSRDWYTEV